MKYQFILTLFLIAMKTTNDTSQKASLFVKVIEAEKGTKLDEVCKKNNMKNLYVNFKHLQILYNALASQKVKCAYLYGLYEGSKSFIVHDDKRISLFNENDTSDLNHVFCLDIQIEEKQNKPEQVEKPVDNIPTEHQQVVSKITNSIFNSLFGPIKNFSDAINNTKIVTKPVIQSNTVKKTNDESKMIIENPNKNMNR
ncbi:hypothetical protein EDEG_02919 [Edhazardia aedis USNM 41457]|uniref:Uncharacterized protein n=1 Tax=Edhazardia aedis (strain USNM 41457) TaxID=1003232 RepID=J9DMW4_EDHAE|nr:hypothetical protein EDEG_02919 [Edhazardia aedis USNM 41457]|eukprot:EJW02687.1 hypothetical protein EDEG_02919 [Edhazardia aedis USNM 41457]